MANAYLMVLKNIGVDESDNTTLKTLTMTVTDSGSAVTGLENFFVVQDTSDDSAVTITAAAVDSTNDWTVTFTTALANTKSIRVQVLDTDNTKSSERIFVDFNAAVSSGVIDLSYKLPDEVGDYKMALDIPNVSTFGSVETSDSFAVSANKPADAQSSVAFYNVKPYLTYFVGDSVALKATIHDSLDADADGNYEFSVSGNLQ